MAVAHGQGDVARVLAEAEMSVLQTGLLIQKVGRASVKNYLESVIMPPSGWTCPSLSGSRKPWWGFYTIYQTIKYRQ